jgi:hypothetical protein
MRRGGGGREEKEEEDEEEEKKKTKRRRKRRRRRREGGRRGDECVHIHCTHSDLQYLLVLPTFLSYSFFHCLDIRTAVTSAVRCLYEVK